MSTWLFLIGAILAEVIATLSLKAALDLPVLYLVVAAGYAVTFVLLAQSLRRGMGLGVAYGIWGASGVTLTAVLAAFLFGEDLNAVMGLGVALVAAGVFLVQTDTQRAQREPVSDSDSRGDAATRSPGVTVAGEAGER
ncbi:MAG TPA: QacE family quaternary ammonium compound efflux SMR transporter [Candidatus Brachybacterium merdavium]|uniref:QacE family quaternary ammonium compound efflux SMR transporter n=1 Tax=Candidatus Brachybacterium merdavium TaxID=2838513 RepID=A0A9D2LFT3_9MICO|nr:QacE family quaternary ammonium compound efflux SMR transporter [Candidatus Brachybacterium merdavium]